jgi:SEC-C motif-containing protein
MRSRYSAYALGNTSYIIETTHPSHPDTSLPLAQRKRSIEHFSKNTQFQGLEILDFSETSDHATVTFKAILFQEGKDASFIEKSEFYLLNGSWLYYGPLSLNLSR